VLLGGKKSGSASTDFTGPRPDCQIQHDFCR
jgi:hypothetical protein